MNRPEFFSLAQLRKHSRAYLPLERGIDVDQLFDEQIAKTPQFEVELEAERFIFHLVSEISDVIVFRKLNIAEIARKAGLNRAAVYKMLNMESTRMVTIVKVAAAMDMVIHIQLCPKEPIEERMYANNQ